MNAGTSADVAVPAPGAQQSTPTRLAAIASPGLPHILFTLRHTARIGALFAFVFGGADALARLHTHRVDLSIGADASIPFVPETTLIYSSLYVMFWTVPFVLRSEHDVRRLARVMAWEIAIAAPFFMALPMAAPLPHGDLGRFAAAFRVADVINLDHNQFPSLHAAFALTVGLVLGARCRWPGRLAFALWSLSIAASTVLTKQHVVADVAGAFALAAVVLRRAGFDPIAGRSRGRSTSR